MTKYCQRYAGARRLGLTAGLLLALLTGCATMPRLSATMQGPAIDCNERAPAEPAYPLPSGSENWREWRSAAHGWIGIATAELEKRNTTAECLTRLRGLKVIR